MLVDLVQVTTSDGIRLHGALQHPDHQTERAPAVDAWLCLHGTGSNFYSVGLINSLVDPLLSIGAAVLRINTRGHDLVCTGGGNRRLLGAAYESVADAPLDIAAWITFLRERGYQRIGLLGHSLGAMKALYALTRSDGPAAAALVAISPPRLSYSHFVASHKADVFLKTFQSAEEYIAQGEPDRLFEVRFPLFYVVSAAAYVDRYGPAEEYNILRHLPKLTCPTLLTYGAMELREQVAFAGIPEEVEKLSLPPDRFNLTVVAGADHVYTGAADILGHRIFKWASRLQPS